VLPVNVQQSGLGISGHGFTWRCQSVIRWP
jgi:hypothetical protein